AQLAVYNHFASSNEKCRSGLTERHYRNAELFYWGSFLPKKMGEHSPHGFGQCFAASWSMTEADEAIVPGCRKLTMKVVQDIRPT
ncbi:hypothetical protein, partial [Ralstonia pseudosolanacearum]|uniref:hypothetical protein n=1 Tax=Ralstonia pseudosolanacearum TaxID=1310165 RepID=UPI002676B61A